MAREATRVYISFSLRTLWGSDGSAAGGGYSDLSDVRPQAPCKRATAQRAALSESLWPG